MAFDRSKFGGSKISDIQKQDKEFEKKTDFGGNGGRAGFIKLKEGKNKVRIFPAHPDTPTFYQPLVVHWMDVLNKWTDRDGKEKEEWKRKPIFSAKAHSEIGKCPIDRYIYYAYKVFGEEFQDRKDRDAKIAPIKGQKGITSSTKFIVYAEIDGEFGRLELPMSVKNSLNEIAIGQEDDDGVIETDPFTDPDSGHCVYITYDKQLNKDKKDRKAADYYKTAIDIKGATPLSDEQLSKLIECQSLEELYVNVYTLKDFDMAVEGLKKFDEEHKFGIFSVDEFIDELEAIHDLIPEVDEETEEEEPKTKKTASKKKEESEAEEEELEEVEEEEDEEEDEESDLPFDVAIADMDEDQLKGVIRRNSLPIRATKRTSLEDLREWVQEELDILDRKEESAEEEEKKETSSKRGKSDRLSKISADLNKK